MTATWVVNRYPEALRRYARREVHQVAWGTRLRHPDAMRLITVADVTEKLDQLLSGVDACKPKPCGANE